MDLIEDTLESLLLEETRSLKLENLEARLDSVAPSRQSDRLTLKAYLGWLSERLLGLNLSDLSEVETEITAWCRSVHARSFTKGEVTDAFNNWQSGQIEVDPSCARRLQLARVEINLRYPSPITQVTASVPRREHDTESVIGIFSDSSTSSVEFISAVGPTGHIQTVDFAMDDKPNPSLSAHGGGAGTRIRYKTYPRSLTATARV